MSQSTQLSAFFRAAASAYRATGNKDAQRIAGWLDEHAIGEIQYGVADEQPPAVLHLPTVARSGDLNPAAQLIATGLAHLPWTVGDLQVPAALRDHFAFNTLIGDDCPIPDARLYFGLFLLAPQTHYPLHWHLAEELYYVLSGTAHWEQGDGVFRSRPPGTLIHHAPNEPHAMATGQAPLLAMWAWFGDLRPDTYRVDGTRGAAPPFGRGAPG